MRFTAGPKPKRRLVVRSGHPYAGVGPGVSSKLHGRQWTAGAGAYVESFRARVSRVVAPVVRRG